MFSIGFTIERTIRISKDIKTIFNMVSDFNTWRVWSPWLCQEPGCPLNITGNPGETGHRQAWNGQQIGLGEMILDTCRPNHQLGYQLSFIRPWKSRATVGFRFEKEAGGTRVTWTMQGSLPFYLFFMKKMMAAWIGCDYDRGLAMLKELAETGTVLSQTAAHGVTDREGLHYVGRKQACTMDDIGAVMENVFTDLHDQITNRRLPQPDIFFSIYHKCDMVRRHCEFTAGCGYYTPPEKLEISGMAHGRLPAHKAVHVTHTGPYRHLGNAWATAMGMQRSQKLKPNKAVPMYEIYVNDPQATDEAEIHTDIFIPVKA